MSSGIERHREVLIGLYEESEHLYGELSALSDRLFDASLDETGCSQGVDDAMQALSRTMADLTRRIEFTKVVAPHHS